MNSLAAIDTSLRRLKWFSAAEKFARALRHYDLALKAGFNPDQPRDDRGRWTDTGAADPDRPDIPEERPVTAQLRNAVIKEVAKWLFKAMAKEFVGGPVMGTALNVLDAASWIHEAYPYISAYLDAPKTLEELQDAVSDTQKGYDIHHIVEKASAAEDGLERSQINAPENLVRVPTLRHWEITGWYMTPNEDYGGLSPRQYLQGRDWSERVSVGLRALIRYGVLQP